MRGLRQSMENEAVSQIHAIPERVERYSYSWLKAMIPMISRKNMKKRGRK